MTAIQGAPGLDASEITTWLTDNLGLRPPIELTRLQGGNSNLTLAYRDAAGTRGVVRRPPLGHLQATAHDVVREFAFVKALHGTAVPVPEPLGVWDEGSSPFFVMGFVPGTALHDEESVRRLMDEQACRRLGEGLVDVLADLHDVDPVAVGLGDFRRRTPFADRQLDRWHEMWLALKTRDVPAVDRVYRALKAQAPAPVEPRIVHGDFRLGNCLASPSGRVNAVVDWEIASLGDPLADLGYLLASWTEPGESAQDGEADRLSARAPSCAPGFPNRAELRERYERRSGRSTEALRFYVALAHWRSACISQSVLARYLAGGLDSSGVDLAALSRAVERSAQLAEATLAEEPPDAVGELTTALGSTPSSRRPSGRADR